MNTLDRLVISLEQDYARKTDHQRRIEAATKELEDLSNQLRYGREAQKLLGTVNDERSAKVLNYVTSVINKALGEIFPNTTRRISLEHKLFGDKHPHINVILEVGDNITRDLKLQTGTGLCEIVSFLYRVCLIEVTGGRKLVIMDELLRGVHKDAMVVIKDLMTIFARDAGFQFVMIEYGIPEAFGKGYEVELLGDTARIVELDEE